MYPGVCIHVHNCMNISLSLSLSLSPLSLRILFTTWCLRHMWTALFPYIPVHLQEMGGNPFLGEPGQLVERARGGSWIGKAAVLLCRGERPCLHVSLLQLIHILLSTLFRVLLLLRSWKHVPSLSAFLSLILAFFSCCFLLSHSSSPPITLTLLCCPLTLISTHGSWFLLCEMTSKRWWLAQSCGARMRLVHARMLFFSRYYVHVHAV